MLCDRSFGARCWLAEEDAVDDMVEVEPCSIWLEELAECQLSALACFSSACCRKRCCMPCMAGLLLLLVLLLSDRSLISYLYYENTFRYIAHAGRPTTMLTIANVMAMDTVAGS
uniref:Uncharacterized protein n=1 Tax=Anopheles merus TaxID=30066 RepID=A0A182V9K0_ANOME